MHPKMTVISGMETYFLPNIYTVLEMKIEFTSPNQILEFIFIVLNKN